MTSCATCGASMAARRSTRVTCSPACKQARYRNAKVADTVVTVTVASSDPVELDLPADASPERAGAAVGSLSASDAPERGVGVEPAREALNAPGLPVEPAPDARPCWADDWDDGWSSP